MSTERSYIYDVSHERYSSQTLYWGLLYLYCETTYYKYQVDLLSVFLWLICSVNYSGNLLSEFTQ